MNRSKTHREKKRRDAEKRQAARSLRMNMEQIAHLDRGRFKAKRERKRLIEIIRGRRRN